MGTGISGPAHVSTEALAVIRWSERVLFLLADPLSRAWLLQLREDAEDLSVFYAVGRPRADTYDQIVDRLLALVRAGSETCAVFYGHPGVFALPTHAVIRRAREEGFEARMLPAISAEDCLFADLGIDPATQGCQSYEATDFLIRARRIDPHAGLVLWQVGVIGVAEHRDERLWNEDGLRILRDALLRIYPSEHPVVVYEATTLPVCEPMVARVPLAGLAQAPVTALSTLWIEPLPDLDVDREMLKALKLQLAKEG